MDYREGIKREVAEIKFLIHDLRVERFINEVIHYHVTVNTDLEIYSAEQVQVLHGADLQELKTKARDLRKAYQDYCNAVQSFASDPTVLVKGNRYVQAIYDMCALVLSPLWGRVDRVLSFLPQDSRSVRSRVHYRNGIRWICGVFYRIEHFLEERENHDLFEEWDVAEDLQEFTRNVVYGYVTEKSSARVDLQLDRLDAAVLGGNRYRFRRMVFNLIMNAVDAMTGRKVGVINLSNVLDGDRTVLRVRDNGSGMTPAKVAQLLTDKESLDGELHSLGFVFVRQTVAEFGGDLSIESEVGRGTTITLDFPALRDRKPPKRTRPGSESSELLLAEDRIQPGLRALQATEGPKAAARVKPVPPAEEKHAVCGQSVLLDYRTSEAEFPGCIFAIAVTEEDRIEFFTHRPYERLWNITHEDLSPMFFEATVRGRLEEDELKTPVLILKAPQNVREYFEFKEVPEEARSPDRYVAMVHDEYVRIARKLVETGMDPEIGVHLTDARKFFPGRKELVEQEPFPLARLAEQKLSAT
ncbi:MAG: ATP-binding protein [Planctomycetota bacterium]